MPTAVMSPLESIQLVQAVVVASTELEEAKRRLAEAELLVAEASANYVSTCRAAKARGVGVAKVKFLATNGIPMTSTFVDGTGKNSTLDESLFAKRIGAKMWKTIVSEVLDKAKLKAALASGTISPVDVAMCAKTGDRASFARFTARTSDVEATTRIPAEPEKTVRIPRQKKIVA